MRILIVNKFLYPNGGSETYIFELGKELERQGHAVEYFGMEHEGRIVGNHAESYTSPMDFHGSGISRLLYPFRILYSREARKKIRKVLEDFNPDVVHLNNFNFQITPSVIYEIRKFEKQKGRKIPIVYTAHDYQWVCPNHMLFLPEQDKLCFACRGGKFGNCAANRCIHGSRIKSILGMLEAKLYQRLRTYGKVDLIICPSAFMRDILATNPLLSGKLQVFHNFLTAGEKKYQDKKDYVLYFGRYAREKGMDTLLSVCRQLQEIPFVFAGGGEYEEEIAKLSNIQNVGFQRGEALIELIGSARFSVFPSEWYENCPFSVMESQYYGTPVIASNMGGVPELLEDGETGELFTAGDQEELKGKIRGLWNNREKLDAYTKKCREKRFQEAPEYAEQLVKEFRRLMESHEHKETTAKDHDPE